LLSFSFLSYVFSDVQ